MIVMDNAGLLGAGGVISERNMSLPATESYNSQAANHLHIEDEYDQNTNADEDLVDDDDMDAASNKPILDDNGAPASIRQNPRGRTEVSNYQSPLFTLGLRSKNSPAKRSPQR